MPFSLEGRGSGRQWPEHNEGIWSEAALETPHLSFIPFLSSARISTFNNYVCYVPQSIQSQQALQNDGELVLCPKMMGCAKS
eukprot:1984802-Amphidinium_carterae.1